MKNLEILSRSSQKLIIWTDCDREGEQIGAEIEQICKSVNPRLDVYRARYSTVTGAELRRACNSLQRLDVKQVAAVEARTEIDLRTGAIFTRWQTLRLREQFGEVLKQRGKSGNEPISYGRVKKSSNMFYACRFLSVSHFGFHC